MGIIGPQVGGEVGDEPPEGFKLSPHRGVKADASRAGGLEKGVDPLEDREAGASQ